MADQDRSENIKAPKVWAELVGDVGRVHCSLKQRSCNGAVLVHFLSPDTHSHEFVTSSEAPSWLFLSLCLQEWKDLVGEKNGPHAA